jgi:hypothetical protein
MNGYNEARDHDIGVIFGGHPYAAQAKREAELEWKMGQAYYQQLTEEYYKEQALFQAQLDELETQGIFARLLINPEFREHLFIERYTHGPVKWEPYIDEEIPF